MTKARDTSHIDWGEYFKYDEKSPSGLVWQFMDDVFAGKLQRQVKSENKYWTVSINNSSYMCHRIIWELCKGKLGVLDNIDHLDGNSENNLLSNLQVKTHQQNCQNKKKQVDNTSGVTGVYYNVKKDRNGVEIPYWMASWVETGKQKTKCFSISKLGYDEAFEYACNFRQSKIEEVNATANCLYTKTHGER